jgi:hypothetical protein
MPTITVERAACAGRMRKRRSLAAVRLVARAFARNPALRTAPAASPIRLAMRTRRRSLRIG